MDIERYRSVWMKAHGYFSLNMAASRGCSFRCNWCAKPIWGNQYLQRTRGLSRGGNGVPEAHVQPGPHLVRRRHLRFPRRLGRRIRRARSQADGGGMPFTIQTRADLLSERMAAALRDAGCAEAWIGAESGSQRVLDAMNKGTTVTEIVTARERLKAARHPRRLLHPARLPGRTARRHPRDARAARARAPGRRRRQRLLPAAGHASSTNS